MCIMKKSIIIIVVVVLVALAAWFFIYKKQAKIEEPKLDVESGSLGSALSGGVGDVQPLDKIPNVNPFNSVETNPYKQGYTNPFGN